MILEFAKELGVEIEPRKIGFTGETEGFYWNMGRRGSADQYDRWFKSEEEAARHFLGSREGVFAIRRLIRSRLHEQEIKFNRILKTRNGVPTNGSKLQSYK